jgi:hypothetical protein
MSKREILVLDDFTEASDKALATAGRWRGQLDALMASLHVSDSENDHEQHRSMFVFVPRQNFGQKLPFR